MGQKTLLDSASKLNGGYLIFDPIPCEYSYLNVHLRTDDVRDSVLIETHLMLSKAPEGWEILDVLDTHGEFLFRQHINNGKVSRRYKDGTVKTEPLNQ